MLWMGDTDFVIVSDRAAREDFAEFFARNREGLCGALWLVSRDRHEAEEVGQDALAKVWERCSSVQTMENPDGYLYRTAMNLLRNRRRRASRLTWDSALVVPTGFEPASPP
jgi:DNA-directed RNA polymerase specialized sigma24 family protein